MATLISQLSLDEALARLEAVDAVPLPQSAWRKSHERRRQVTYQKIQNRLYELQGVDPKWGREFFWKLDMVRALFFRG